MSGCDLWAGYCSQVCVLPTMWDAGLGPVIYVLLDDKLIPWKVNITKLMAHNKCMNLINSVTNTRVHNTGSNYDKVKYMLQIII